MHTSMVMGGRRAPAAGPALSRPEEAEAPAAAEAEEEDSEEEADSTWRAAWEGSRSPENRSGAMGLDEVSEADSGTSMSSSSR